MSSNSGPFNPRNLTYFGLGAVLGGVLGGLLMLPLVAGIIYALLILAFIGFILGAMFEADFISGPVGWLAGLFWGAIALIGQMILPEDQTNPSAGRVAYRIGIICGAVLVYGILYLRKGAV